MKIIDLVQNILKLKTTNEEVYIPTFIKYKDEVYCFDDKNLNYYANEGQYSLFCWDEDMFDILNDEIEIIKEEKEIEKLSIQQVGYQETVPNSPTVRERDIKNIVMDFNEQNRKICKKINELIREVNKLKEEGK